MPEKVALTYVALAYGAAFAVLIGFVTRTAVGTRRLEQEVERLRLELRALGDDDEEGPAAAGEGRPAQP
jgi:heme exporter protein CcmD